MRTRHKFLSYSLPLSTLLFAWAAVAAPLPPLEIVHDDFIPQKSASIQPVKLAQHKKQHKKRSKHMHQTRAEAARVIVPDIIMEKNVIAENSACASHPVSWQRSCADFGYPAHFVGAVLGQTQFDCQAQEQRESWQKNSCAPVLTQLTALVPPVVSAAEVVPMDAGAVVLDPIKLAAVDSAAILVTTKMPAEQIQLAVAAPAYDTVAGRCGAVANQKLTTIPSDNLCASGAVEQLVGQGPWQWSCAGVGGGDTANCMAFVSLEARDVDGTKVQGVTAMNDSHNVIPDAQTVPRAVETEDMRLASSIPAQEPTATLVTPQLATPILATAGAEVASEAEPSVTLQAEINTQSADLSTAVLATPRLDLAAHNHVVQAGVTDYIPATPIRSNAILQPVSAGYGTVIEASLASLKFEQGVDNLAESVLVRLELVGQKLAANRMAQVTIAAYAAMTDSTDARAARRLSLARAMTVRDALLLGGASSEQIKMRALGANVPSGDADRVDLSDH